MKKLISSLAFLLITFFANADTIYVDDDDLGYFNDIQSTTDGFGLPERIVSETLSGANTIPEVKLLAYKHYSPVKIHFFTANIHLILS